jgi:hypothetical protein
MPGESGVSLRLFRQGRPQVCELGADLGAGMHAELAGQLGLHCPRAHEQLSCDLPAGALNWVALLAPVLVGEFSLAQRDISVSVPNRGGEARQLGSAWRGRSAPSLA